MKLRLLIGMALTVPLLGASPVPSHEAPLIDAMRKELERATTIKLPHAEAPYHVGYWVADKTTRSIEATLGALISDTTERSRILKVDLRVGSRFFDNSNFSGGGSEDDDDFIENLEQSAPHAAPLDDDPGVLRRDLWLATDAAYKSAVEMLERKRAAKQNEVAWKPEVPSFSDDTPTAVIVENERPATAPDPAELARHVSAVFRTFTDVQRSEVHVFLESTRRRFVSSDGGLVIEPSSFFALEIGAETQADDGMVLKRSAFFTPKRGARIDEDRLKADARRVGQELTALRRAPVAEDYTGPVLFEERAAAQIVFELLGDSLSGTPPPGGQGELDGPFARRVGKRVLPRGVSVVDDPTLSEIANLPLIGHYAADDEGMRAERTILVEDGFLRTFLMSRTPREGISRSNGHGRSGLVGLPRGRAANLILTARDGLSKAAMRRRLLAAIREEHAPCGLVVTELGARTSATSGQIVPPPELMYRITPDGKETLLRGATLAPIAVRELRDALAVGRELSVYAFLEESEGGLDVPVSIAAPALLFGDLEVRGPSGPNKRPPVVPQPEIARP